MVRIEYTKVVWCPDPDIDMDVPIADLTGCDYYDGVDEHSECITCNFEDGDDDDSI